MKLEIEFDFDESTDGQPAGVIIRGTWLNGGPMPRPHDRQTLDAFEAAITRQLELAPPGFDFRPCHL